MATQTPIWDLCRAIAAALGPEWSAPAPEDQNWCSNLIHANGMSLFCRRQPNKRLEIETEAIEGITEEGRIIFRYNHDKPSITVSAVRDPKAIAGDIRRRLLPEATAWWQEGMRKKQVIEAERASERQLRDRLLKFPHATLASGPFDHNEIRVSTTDNAWIVAPSKNCVTFNRMGGDEIVALIETYYQLKGQTP